MIYTAGPTTGKIRENVLELYNMRVMRSHNLRVGIAEKMGFAVFF